MALNTFKRNYLTPLHFKGLIYGGPNIWRTCTAADRAEGRPRRQLSRPVWVFGITPGKFLKLKHP